MAEVYVFVVCGEKEHIDTLHLSVSYLTKYSQKEIIVLTDSSRNELPIDWKNTIDIKTPVELNHHQASIYLKTGIYKFVPKGNLYCYLDTDVLTVSASCDEIFKEFVEPIRFAADHCSMSRFSPYAVNCGCLEKNEKDRKRFTDSLELLDRNKELNSFEQRLERAKIKKFYQNLENSFLRKILLAIRYKLSAKEFKLNEKYTLNKSSKEWRLPNGEIVKHELDYTKLEKETGIRLNKWNGAWGNNKNENIFDTRCNHLQQQIYDTFSIEIKETNFQHWNGGVFLFNDSSHSFLGSWHTKTMKIFGLKGWKTRDQGTLIATVWEHGLQNHPIMDKKWNFIADYNNEDLFCEPNGISFTDDVFETTFEPSFIHIYHHWGDESWHIWKNIKNILNH